MLTVLFGLFHGLILFPSLLAIVGPENRLTIPMLSHDHQIITIGESTAITIIIDIINT